MSTYVTLSQVTGEDRDELLEDYVKQSQLDRAENCFLSLVKNRGITASDVVTPVAFEVTEYIIAETFRQAAIAGASNNLVAVDLNGDQEDPYKLKKKHYEIEVAKWDKSLSIEVITQQDEEPNERMAINNRLQRS